MNISAPFVLLIVAGCASDPSTAPDQSASDYRREVRKIEALEEAESRRMRCARSGGTWHIRRQSSGRLPPSDDELRLATCE